MNHGDGTETTAKPKETTSYFSNPPSKSLLVPAGELKTK